jgi:UPF0042 nucleotide-binding protein
VSDRPNIVIVTGISGAGKSTALRALEDVGLDAVDNPPLTLASTLIEGGSGTVGLAIGVDIRSRGFSTEAVLRLLENYPGARLMYLDCDTDLAVRRFTETRRRHPLVEAGSPAGGIRREQVFLAPLREHAERVIDTSLLTGRELQRLVQAAFGAGADQPLRVAIESFSFPKGTPRGADLVFDVRFLANPHYQDALRPLTGLDARVAAFVMADPNFRPFAEKLQDLLLFLLPLYEQEGKSYLTVAIGCTGGRHRSVMLTEHLGAFLTNRGWPVRLEHREIERRSPMHMVEDEIGGAA